MKVLVVDDVGYVRHYLDRLLTSHDHVVITAASGGEAIDHLKSDNGINAVLTDLLMPGMDGIELFKAARKIDRYDDKGQLPPLEFILITALRPSSSIQRKEASLLQEALSIGFVDVMLKPVDNDRLIGLLVKIEARLAGQPEPLDPPAANASAGSSAAAAPSRASGAQPGQDWKKALEELRTKCDDRFDEFDRQLLELKSGLDELAQLQRELQSAAEQRAEAISSNA